LNTHALCPPDLVASFCHIAHNVVNISQHEDAFPGASSACHQQATGRPALVSSKMWTSCVMVLK
jgi:hypothetical protein